MDDESGKPTPGTPGWFGEMAERAQREAGTADPTRCRNCETAIDSGALCDRCDRADRHAQRIERALRDAGKDYRGLRFGGQGELADVSKRVKSEIALQRGAAMCTQPRVLLTGQTGAGKTALACAMLAERLSRTGEVGAFMPCRDLMIAHARLESSDPRLENRARTADIVVLDELGNGREMPSSPIGDIIQYRARNGMATWITTYLTYGGVATKFGGEIARHVFERATIIDCNPPKKGDTDAQQTT